MTSRVTSQTDGWVHQFTEEQQRNSGGTHVLLLPDPAPARSVDAPSTPGTAGLAGQSPCWSGKVREGSTGLPPLTLPCSPSGTWTLAKGSAAPADMILPLCAPLRDTQSCTFLGPAAEEVIKKGVVPYVKRHASLGTAPCSKFGSSWDFWGCYTLLCCLSLLTRSTNTLGLSVLLHTDWVTPGHSSCWPSVCLLLSCWTHRPEGLHLCPAPALMTLHGCKAFFLSSWGMPR